MDVTCIQHDVAWEDKPRNIARVAQLVADAAPAPGGLFVLPEMFATGYSFNLPGILEDHDDSAERCLADLAARHQCTVVGGVARRCPDGKPRNQALVVGPDRREIARYSKMRPTTPLGETKHFAPGEQVVTCPLGPWVLAPFVCYDLRFPELFRQAARQGADLFIVIASWPVERIEHWVKLLQARAIENQAAVVGCNRVGRDPNHAYTGRSLIIDHFGRVLADAGERETALTAALDHHALLAYRKALPFLADM